MSRTVDTGRRRLLVNALTTVGLLGAASAAYPFIRSWEPSERAKALGAPIDVDITALEPGAMLVVAWRGKPVYVVRRPPELLATLAGLAHELVDPLSLSSVQPDYARNLTRSRTPEYLVVLGVCTHLSCAPSGVFSGPSPRPDVVPVWPGGFYCACHGSVYDAAGRVFKDVPAPANLPVPPYYFATTTRIVVGVSDAAASAA
jgi:ubiquinol-cytochrome c reductase iron-sulfur subunit